MKTVLSFILIVAISLSLVACAGESKAEQETTQSNSQKVEAVETPPEETITETPVEVEQDPIEETTSEPKPDPKTLPEYHSVEAIKQRGVL